MTRIRFIPALLGAAMLAACSKDGVQNITAPVSGARVKFFNFGVTAPGVNFYANTQKVTAISSTLCQPPADTTKVCQTTGLESTTGVAYGAAGSNGLYSAIAPGQTTLAGKIAAAVDKDLAIGTVSTSLEDGKYYSFFMSGIYDATAKKVDAFVVEDVLPPIDNNTYVRFVNAIPNSGSVTLFVTPSGGTETAISSALPYKGVGSFVKIGTGGIGDLTLRASAGSPVLATRAAASFVGGHAYTITARGDGTSTVTATKPALDYTGNR